MSRPLAQMRRIVPRALVGGLDHVKFPEMSAAAVRKQIRAANAEAGGRVFDCARLRDPELQFPELVRAAQAEVDKT